MTDEKWENLIFMIEEKFGVVQRKKEKIEVAQTSTSQPVLGEKESIEFDSPQGRMKLERTARPKVLDKKVLSTKRIGGRVAVDYVYSQEEKTYRVKLYRFNEKENNWQEVDVDFLSQ